MAVLTSREGAEEYIKGDPFVIKGMESNWYINEWAILALVGGLVQPLSRYLQDVEPMLRAHHHKFDLHPNVNRKDLTIADEVHIDEEPPPEDLWRNLLLRAKKPDGDE